MRKLVEIDDNKLRKKIEIAKDPYRIPRKYKMSDEMILEIAEQLKEKRKGKEDGWFWQVVSYNQPLTEKFILENQDKVSWHHVFMCQNITEEFFLNEKKRIGVGSSWYYISRNKHITDDFIEKYKNKMDWTIISEYRPLTEEFIIKYQNKVDWKKISMYQQISELFILTHQDKINFANLVRNKHLAGDFFEINKDKIWTKLYSTDLSNIVKYQKLSEETLREIKKGKTVWRAISLGADMSREFVMENYNNIIPSYVTLWNKNISNEVKDEVKLIEKLSNGKHF